MSRLTLRLPESLHRHLERLARSENVSLNQYIVYALTRQTSQTYNVYPLSEAAIEQQGAAYAALLQSLGTATHDQIAEVLAEREAVQPEAGLDPETVRRLQERAASYKSK